VSQYSGIRISEATGHNIKALISALPRSSDVFLKLLDYWEIEMSKRLSEVIMPDIDTDGIKTSLIIKITDLGYYEALIARSL
jgi:hypothetical protein